MNEDAQRAESTAGQNAAEGALPCAREAGQAASDEGRACEATTNEGAVREAASADGATSGADMRSTNTTAPRTEASLRAQLGLPASDFQIPQRIRRYGWAATLAVTLLAAITRLWNLGRPGRLMFDETYYVKDSYALWHNGYESRWLDGADEAIAQGSFEHLTGEGSYIVHPPLGKWLIATGMELAGPANSASWRLATAIAGILTVALLARLTFRLTRSAMLTFLAGFLLALDGVGITESRIALLDVFLGLFSLLAVYCLIRDRTDFRDRLATILAGTAPGTLAPRILVRPWLLAAGLAAGAACSVKWSGAYMLAVMGLTVVVWDLTALRRVQARRWALDGLLRRGSLDFLHLVPVAFAVYVTSWWSWFTHVGGYKHGWAADQRIAGTPQRAWLPDSLNDLLEYHLSMYRFHVGLDSEHPYMSHPAGWLVQWRPTSFYWRGTDDMAGQCSGSSDCVQAITSIGNLGLWWPAVVALVVAIILAIRTRDWRWWVPLMGYAGLYLPWFSYAHRTIFTFYVVAFVPFVALLLTVVLGWACGLLPDDERPAPARRLAWQGCEVVSDEGEVEIAGEVLAESEVASLAGAKRGGLATEPATRLEAWLGVEQERVRPLGLGIMLGVLIVVSIVAVLWWPLWTGQSVSYEFWRAHMLLPSWI